MQQPTEIRYPTQAERRRAIRLAAVVVLLGIALLPLLWLLDGYIVAIGSLDREDAITAMGELVYALAILIVLVTSGLATWLWRLAAKIRLSKQYPPADMLILKPVQIRRERAALQMAGIASVSAAVLLLLGFAVAVLLLGIMGTLA